MSVATKNVLVLLKKKKYPVHTQKLFRDRSFITSRGRGGGGKVWRGVQFSKRLDFRGAILKMDKCEGDRNIKTQDWPSM